MRKPERIGPFLDRLKKIWEAHPDLRFFQLLAVIQNDHSFYTEDKDIINALEKYYDGSKYYIPSNDLEKHNEK